MCIFAVASTIAREDTCRRSCCELLQNVYLCSSKHNSNVLIMSWGQVVNCFKMCIFAVASTIRHPRRHQRYAVVNCFKMCIFAVASTIWVSFIRQDQSCELLQNVYLCSSKHNRAATDNPASWVVNCFKMCIFAVASTIEKLDEKVWRRCELLQNVYLCSSKHNSFLCFLCLLCVVNCFKMCIFAVASTISASELNNATLLWIASKCVSLQ